MRSPPDVGVVIVAAGRGVRAGGGEPKQFRAVGGVPALLRAIRPFAAHPAVLSIAVALPPEFAAAPPAWLAPLVGDRLRVVAGGPERLDSMELALGALDPACRVVLVHDGARPFVGAGVIDAVIAEARAGRAALAALPVHDTLKEADLDPATGAALVRRTVPRDRLWRAQTPQAFPADLLRQGLARARRDGTAATDDVGLVEPLGATIVLVLDSPRNLKLTGADDFAMAEAIARVAP